MSKGTKGFVAGVAVGVILTHVYMTAQSRRNATG